MPFFAVMQGRMVPPEGGRFQCFPRVRWRDEFALAKRAGLDGIEWIFDQYGEEVNPLCKDSGIQEMLRLCEETGIRVSSLCADYFLERPFLRTSHNGRRELTQKLEWLLWRCKVLGIKRIVIPFVDNARIENPADEEVVVAIVDATLPALKACNLELHLETSLGPEAFSRLLERCSHPLIRVNYDSGNSASLGYDVRNEFAAYGSRIGSVHIKDRKLGGGTVSLGSGNADLPAVFSGLAVLGYTGDYVLQIARGEAGQEVHWIAENLSWVTRQIEVAKNGVR